MTIIKNKLLMMAVVLLSISIQGCSSSFASNSDNTQNATGAFTVSNLDKVKDKKVTWRFQKQAVAGRFANGDLWVVGPVTIVSITPAFTGKRHGWEVNPSSNNQGLDTRITDFVADLVPSLPYKAAPGESLVKAVSITGAGACDVPCLQSVSVLTVLASPPPDGGASAFRPSYFGTDKTMHSVNDLRIELLPNLPPTRNAMKFSEVERAYSNLQLDHKEGWAAREMHPVDSLPDYGSAIATRNAEAALALMMKGNESQKRQAAINYVNYGLDVYYQHRAGVKWYSNGGHGEGRKLPAAMASVLLQDSVMQNYLASAGRGTFGETNGARYSAIAGTSLWGQYDGERDYWEQIVNNTGSKFQRDPYQQIDGGDLGKGNNELYQFCCNSKPWEAIIAATRLMPALSAPMNSRDLDIYVQRWRSRGYHTQPDTCAPATSSMADYGVLFGPDGAGGCIPDSDPSDGIGRFPRRHGQNAASGYYESQFSDELWSTYLK